AAPALCRVGPESESPAMGSKLSHPGGERLRVAREPFDDGVEALEVANALGAETLPERPRDHRHLGRPAGATDQIDVGEAETCGRDGLVETREDTRGLA